MEKQPNSRMCFVCGIDNPIGLHLHFYTDDEGRCIARFRPKPYHHGYPGQLHGGLISTLTIDLSGRVSSYLDSECLDRLVTSTPYYELRSPSSSGSTLWG